MKELVAASAAIFVWGLTPLPAHAVEPGYLEKYLTPKGHPTVTVVEEAQAPVFYRFSLAPDAGSGGGLGEIGGAISDISQIINLGKEIWVIIEANKPVVNVQTDSASALPAGARTWQDLQGWQAPISRLYRYTYENLFGMKVVDFSYRVIYAYGGNVNGKGRYLANVTIVPADLSVMWGYKFNAKATVPSVLNAGSASDPIGAAQLLIDWSIDTVMKHEQSTQSYYVRGDGAFSDLSQGN